MGRYEPRGYTDAEIERVIELLRSGATYAEIERQTGAPGHVAGRLRKAYGIPLAKRRNRGSAPPPCQPCPRCGHEVPLPCVACAAQVHRDDPTTRRTPDPPEDLDLHLDEEHAQRLAAFRLTAFPEGDPHYNARNGDAPR